MTKRPSEALSAWEAGYRAAPDCVSLRMNLAHFTGVMAQELDLRDAGRATALFERSLALELSLPRERQRKRNLDVVRERLAVLRAPNMRVLVEDYAETYEAERQRLGDVISLPASVHPTRITSPDAPTLAPTQANPAPKQHVPLPVVTVSAETAPPVTTPATLQRTAQQERLGRMGASVLLTLLALALFLGTQARPTVFTVVTLLFLGALPLLVATLYLLVQTIKTLRHSVVGALMQLVLGAAPFALIALVLLLVGGQILGREPRWLVGSGVILLQGGALYLLRPRRVIASAMRLGGRLAGWAERTALRQVEASAQARVAEKAAAAADPRDMLKDGLRLLGEGKHRDALKIFERAVRADSRSVQAQVLRLMAVAELKDSDKIVRYAQEALRVAPRNGTIHHTLGLGYIGKAVTKNLYEHIEALRNAQRELELALNYGCDKPQEARAALIQVRHGLTQATDYLRRLQQRR
jgi:tetratricopeptide (TPR) repeat protein